MTVERIGYSRRVRGWERSSGRLTSQESQAEGNLDQREQRGMSMNRLHVMHKSA